MEAFGFEGMAKNSCVTAPPAPGTSARRFCFPFLPFLLVTFVFSFLSLHPHNRPRATLAPHAPYTPLRTMTLWTALLLSTFAARGFALSVAWADNSSPVQCQEASVSYKSTTGLVAAYVSPALRDAALSRS